MFDSIRGAIRYVRAREALGKGDLALAKSRIEEAKRLLGSRIDKPNVYDINLQAAQIYYKLNDYESAERHLARAEIQVQSNKRLSKPEKDYLLDYCNIFRNDLNDNKKRMVYRVNSSDYNLVRARIRKEFPISWVNNTTVDA